MRVLERWVKHFLGVDVTIQHRREIDDKQWWWHVGLDAVASSVLNDLYNREAVDDGRMERLLCLFELRFGDPTDMRPAIAGRPVYLANGDGRRESSETETTESAAESAAKSGVKYSNSPLAPATIRAAHKSRTSGILNSRSFLREEQEP